MRSPLLSFLQIALKRHYEGKQPKGLKSNKVHRGLGWKCFYPEGFGCKVWQITLPRGIFFVASIPYFFGCKK